MKRWLKNRWEIVAILTMLLTAGVNAAPLPGGTLAVGLDQEPPTLDPHASPSATTFQIMSGVTENLLFRGLDGKVVPWLATDYSVAPDGKSFTFHLRTDVTFSDGVPLTADVVKWNFDRIVNPNFKAGGALIALAGYAGSTVIDDHTVRVNFKGPYAPFLAYAAHWTLSLLSPRATLAQGDAVNKQPVGSGPFTVAEWVAKDHITLARNPRFERRSPWSNHQGPSYLEKIIWRIIPQSGIRVVTIQSGETKMISALATPAAILRRLETDKSFRVERNPYPGSPDIWLLNVKMPPTNDLAVRRALNYGINRAAYVESLYKGLGTQAYAPLSMGMLDDPSLRAYYPFSPAKAAQLLDEAGWKEGPGNVRMKDGKPLTIVINSVNFGTGDLPIAQLLQGQLLQLGVDAKLKNQALAPFFEDNWRCATNGPIMFLRSVDWDALYALFNSVNIGSNFNWSCYSNPEIDKLLQDGRAQWDPLKRRGIYLKIEQALLEQAVSVPLVDEFSVWVLRANVTGVKYSYAAYPMMNDVQLTK